MMEYLQILVVPSGLGAVLFALGVLAMLLPQTRNLSRMFLFGSIGVLFFFSFGPVATLLLAPLEYQFPAMKNPERHGDIRTIVLLTGYASNDPEMPPSSRLSVASAFRVLETASLAQRRPDCRIIISGNALAAEAMAFQLQAMGLPSERITLESASANTAASADNLVALIGKDPVFLVTSAGHMRRSLAVFARQGIHATAVPTDHQLPSRVSRAEWTVSPFNLNASDIAMHEYAGLLWYRLTDRI